MIYLHEIAQECLTESRNIARWVRNKDFNYFMVPHPTKLGSQTMAFDETTAKLIIDTRKRYVKEEFDDIDIQEDSYGFFYLIQTVPDIKPDRIKLGYTNSLDQRISQHKTTCPTANIIKYWKCKQCWEKAVIQMLSKYGKLIGGEVYDFDDLNKTIQFADEIFKMLF